MRTDWSKRQDPEAYQNFDETGQHTPGPSTEAVRFLVEQRDVLGFGSEAIGTDAGQGYHLRPPYPCHYYMHGAGRYGLQCLSNLDLLPPAGAVLICPPLKIEKGSGSPLRVLALVGSVGMSAASEGRRGHRRQRRHRPGDLRGPARRRATKSSRWRAARADIDHPKLHSIEVDLADRAATAQAAAELVRRFEVTTVVHNAGVIRPALLADVKLDDLDALVDLHLGCAIQLVQAALPAMRAQRFGRVVLLSSRAALGLPTRTSYSATKAGMLGMARTWALELGARGHHGQRGRAGADPHRHVLRRRRGRQREGARARRLGAGASASANRPTWHAPCVSSPTPRTASSRGRCCTCAAAPASAAWRCERASIDRRTHRSLPCHRAIALVRILDT